MPDPIKPTAADYAIAKRANELWGAAINGPHVDVLAAMLAREQALEDAAKVGQCGITNADREVMKTILIPACHEAIERGDYDDHDDMVAIAAHRRLGQQQGARGIVEGSEPETDWEVWQDGMAVAFSSSEADAYHYLAVYSQDGPAKLVKAVTYRTDVVPTPPAQGETTILKAGDARG